jgi:uncharacterized delta-60 repeat protein
MRAKTILTVILFLITSYVYSQDNYRVLLYNGPGNGLDQSVAVVLDISANVYVTGNSNGGSSTNDDFATIKYNAYGVQQWVARYNGTGSYIDQAKGIALDAANNVYVTGWSYMEPGLECGTPDYVTIKYNNNGVQQWVAKYNGTGNSDDFANALAVDASGNVYVTGSSIGSSTGADIATVKYNTSGVQQWVVRYDGPSHGADVGKKVTLDREGNVLVIGSSAQTNAGLDYIILKYSSDGTLLWSFRYNGPGAGDDVPYGIATDGISNVYVTGSSKGAGTNLDFLTLKINSSGTQLWSARYTGAGLSNDTDVATAVAVDLNGNVYLTGYSKNAGTGFDYVTMRLSPDGYKQWVNFYNGPANGIDKPWDLKLVKKTCAGGADAPCWVFEVVITGQSQGIGTGYDMATIKYDMKGNTIWTRRYNNTANTDDISQAVGVIDESDFVYISGYSNSDYATLWYFPNSNPNNPVSGNPTETKLVQNYPNPFNPSTNIKYQVHNAGQIVLKVYNVLGKEVATLVNSELNPGTYSVNWDASALSSGVYFYTLEANGVKMDTKKMFLVK